MSTPAYHLLADDITLCCDAVINDSALTNCQKRDYLTGAITMTRRTFLQKLDYLYQPHLREALERTEGRGTREEILDAESEALIELLIGRSWRP